MCEDDQSDNKYLLKEEYNRNQKKQPANLNGVLPGGKAVTTLTFQKKVLV